MALASQPFRLVWPDGDREREHTPDYFARLADGTGVVVDVRPQDLDDEEAAECFAFTARICESVGWQFRPVGDLSHPFRANLPRLARYRHPRCCRAPVADRLREVFCEPKLLLAGAERVGDRLAVLPVLCHLLWQHELTADLVSAPLGAGAVVCLRAGGGREVRASGAAAAGRPRPVPGTHLHGGRADRGCRFVRPTSTAPACSWTRSISRPPRTSPSSAPVNGPRWARPRCWSHQGVAAAAEWNIDTPVVPAAPTDGGLRSHTRGAGTGKSMQLLVA